MDDVQKQKEIDLAYAGRGDWWARIAPFRQNRKKLRKFKIMLCERQNWRCCYCGVGVDIETSFKDDSATFEHVVPRAWGGPDEERNLVISCYKCNNMRGHSFSSSHIELLQMYENGEISL